MLGWGGGWKGLACWELIIGLGEPLRVTPARAPPVFTLGCGVEGPGKGRPEGGSHPTGTQRSVRLQPAPGPRKLIWARPGRRGCCPTGSESRASVGGLLARAAWMAEPGARPGHMVRPGGLRASDCSPTQT